MPPKKIVPKPDIDIVEINQSDLDNSENEADTQGENENENSQFENDQTQNTKQLRSAVGESKKKAYKASKSKTIKQPKKKIVEEEDEEVEEEPKSKKSISKARLNALAAGRKRAHEKREEKKKEAVEALRLQLKKELEAEGYSKKEANADKVIQKIENEKVQNEKVQFQQQQSQPQQIQPVTTPHTINRQSRLRIVEDSNMSQHNGFSTYGGFQIPHVGGIIKKIGRKLI